MILIEGHPAAMSSVADRLGVELLLMSASGGTRRCLSIKLPTHQRVCTRIKGPCQAVLCMIHIRT